VVAEGGEREHEDENENEEEEEEDEWMRKTNESEEPASAQSYGAAREQDGMRRDFAIG
jgi:hypothetical protein